MNLIYQYWDGEIRPGVTASVKNMKQYAKRIGVEHIFEHNPRHFYKQLGDTSKYYGAFKPIFDESFEKYDNVLFLDCDIFAVDGLTENVFDIFNGDIGICTEPFQPKQRVITLGQITRERDEQWASILKQEYGITLPRTEENLLKVYNSGVVLYSKKGRDIARDKFVPFQQYINKMRQGGMINFYSLDQNYLHAMMFHCGFNIQELPNAWNCYIHKTIDKVNPVRRVNDCRTPDAKFVHVQMGGADMYDEQTLYRIVNLPKSMWGIPDE